jgi:hypothetical protein
MFGQFWTGKEWAAPMGPSVDPSFIARRAAVQQEVVTLLETGRLVCALRPVVGGEMAVCPADWWNTEPKHSQGRFYHCQMDPKSPFRYVISQNNSWIFITRDSLDKELSRHPFAPTPTTGDVHLSPYMITMLSVIKQLRITSENQPRKKEIENAIREYWKQHFNQLKLTENLCGHMATLVRQQEGQRGRAARKKNLSDVKNPKKISGLAMGSCLF